MKKFLNDPETLVAEALEGLVRAFPERLRADAAERVCVRADAPVVGKVGLVSGGGSGHEPLHAGLIGPGLLDAACLGDVFTSPTADQVVAAAKAVDGGAGVLFIVKNYTGDVLNFRFASELARETGIEVEMVVVDDDCATRGQPVGRRGVAGTVFVEKIAGAAADRGDSLAQVAEIARKTIERTRSLGVALSACTTPMAARPTFELGDNEIEFGVGIHGEAGLRREQHRSAGELVERMLDVICGELEPGPGTALLGLVNGLGATPLIELYLLNGELARQIESRGLKLERNLVGNFVTSLDMAGASISLLVLNEQLRELWDAPASTPAFVTA